MTYEIKANGTFGINEVYFESKPADAVREALKALRLRWNGAKKCWYGYAKEQEILEAIRCNMETDSIVYTDGYMGGGAVYGSKSNLHLFGADLSKAIREDIKAAGIKGVTVSCKTYTGGQSITATVKASPDMFVPFAEFLESYKISPSIYWIETEDGRSIHREQYMAAEYEEREEIRKSAAARSYKYFTGRHRVTINRLEDCGYLTAETIAKIEKVNRIICAYRYDESNGMVDYYNTNFYYDIDIRPA